MTSIDAQATIDGERLGISGALSVWNAPRIWAQISTARFMYLDLSGLTAADSAALAMLSRLQENNAKAEVIGLPAHLDALRQAYRLDPQLRFTA